MAQRLTHAFPVGADALWRALRAALPRVTTHASFWEQAHRVEWSTDGTNYSWGQRFNSSVEPGADESSLLTLSGKSLAWASFGDRGRRAEIFRTLVDAVSETLSKAPVMDDLPTEDRVRYWNGEEWSAEPPPTPG